LRLGRKEGVELSSLFKRKEGKIFGREGVREERSNLFFFCSSFAETLPRAVGQLAALGYYPNVLLITIIVRST